MKWVKIIVGSFFALIILATAAIAVAGMGADSNRMACSVVIHQKAAAIWPWLWEGEKAKQWVSWLAEVRRDEGEPTTGRKAVWVMEDRNNNNMRMEINATVESAESNRKLALRLDSAEGFHGNSVYTLTELPDGSTRIDSDSRYTFDNGFARFMTPLVLWQAKKKMAGDFDHLRALLENR